jgi:DNA-binding FrmR family transcriptional regulator
MDSETKHAAQQRLRRISGQVGGIERMVEDDRYCIDILLQIAAVRAALARVGQLLLDSHVQTCVVGAFRDKDPKGQQAKIDELLKVFHKYCNT